MSFSLFSSKQKIEICKFAQNRKQQKYVNFLASEKFDQHLLVAC